MTDLEPLRALLADLEATRTLGRLFARELEPGVVLALVGELGAGKTSLAKAAIAALGGAEEDDVVSPTYVLACEYPGRVEVTHLDAYRLSGAAALTDLDLDFTTRAVLVEWADRVADSLPADRVTVELQHTEGGRRVTLTSGGPVSAAVVASVKAAGEIPWE